MTNKGLDMSMKDDQERCRSLVCDPNGIIVAEMVYRCMICFYVSDTMVEARQHYVLKHIEEDDLNNDNCTDAIDDMDDICPKNIPKQINPSLNKYHNGNRSSSENNLDNFHKKSYRGEDTPIDMSPSSDSFDRYLPLVTITEGFESTSIGNLANGGKSGYVNCAVCGVTRYYSCVQRRYGQYTCVTCYRYFRTFLAQPKRYSCPNLGQCLLNVRTRCRACWIKACIDLFTVDLVRQQIIDAYLPIKRASSNNSEDEHVDTFDTVESNSPIDDKMDHNQFANLNDNNNNNTTLMNFYNLFGGLNDNNNNNTSLINHNNNVNNGNDNLFITPKRNINYKTVNGNHNTSNNSTSNISTDNIANGKDNKTVKQAKTSSGKKIWSCGKCATCVAEDCGKCIYCLDRPKFGGPFIKKQRCIKRRCLMKIKNKNNSSNGPLAMIVGS